MPRRPREQIPTTAPCQISRELAARLRIVANHRNLTMTEVLDKYAGAFILREYKRCLNEMTREIGENGGA